MAPSLPLPTPAHDAQVAGAATAATTSPQLNRRARFDRLARHPLAVTGALVLLVRLLTSITLPLVVAGRSAAVPGPTPFRFDGVYYLAIARSGYSSTIPRAPNGHALQSMLAFFPGYPLVLRAAHATGLSWLAAVVTVSTLAAVAAGVLIAAAVMPWAGPRVAVIAAVIWAAQPTAFVLSMAYSEGLFTAATAGCLLALYKRRWLVAGLCAGAASGIRPSGAVLIIACAAAAIPVVVRSKRPGPLIAPLLAPAGVVAYFSYLQVHVGHWNAWFITENDGWGAHTDFGYDTARRLVRSVVHPWTRPGGIAVIAAVVVTALLIAWLIRDRRKPGGGRLLAPPEALITGIGFALLAVSTSNVFSSIPRFFLPAFPLLPPLARRISGLPGWLLLVLALLATAASVAIGATVLVSSRYPM